MVVPHDRCAVLPVGHGSSRPAAELMFTSGAASAFIDQLWQHLPAAPEGALIGAIHLRGGRGQVAIRVRHPQVTQLVVLPGQVLLVQDPADPSTWTVTDTPDTMHLRQPR